jgi:hypothetical protein
MIFFFGGGIIFYSIFLGEKKSMKKKLGQEFRSQNYFTWRKQEVCHTAAFAILH